MRNFNTLVEIFFVIITKFIRICFNINSRDEQIQVILRLRHGLKQHLLARLPHRRISVKQRHLVTQHTCYFPFIQKGEAHRGERR